MAKLYFRYGTMGSSKTASALMVQFNYQERGQKVLMLKPEIEARDGHRQITSRIGLSAPCQHVEDMITPLGEIISGDFNRYDCVIVDEAQFMTEQQVAALAWVADELDIPVLCYGLRTDFQGNLFPGSAALFAAADKIEEIKTICWCGKKATYNARYNEEGIIIREGDQILMGGNESYIALCRKHFRSGNRGYGNG